MRYDSSIEEFEIRCGRCPFDILSFFPADNGFGSRDFLFRLFLAGGEHCCVVSGRMLACGGGINVMVAS